MERISHIVQSIIVMALTTDLGLAHLRIYLWPTGVYQRKWVLYIITNKQKI